MTTTPDDDRIAHLARTYNDGERGGYIRGSIKAIGRTGLAVMRDLIRRFGADHVERELGDYPDLRESFTEAREELASATTDRICMRDIEGPRPNSPQDVGAQGEPGGWTGGLTSPPEQAPTRKRVRREDSR